MDFFEDLRGEILKHLPHDSQNVETSKALSTMPVSSLLIVFLNWLNRLVHPHPRAIHYSREVLENPCWKKHQSDLRRLIKKIEFGADVTPNLSRRVKDGFTLNKGLLRKNLNKRMDLDLLLNDWGVHHLHLSSTMESDGFVARDGPVLFAIFKHTAAFLIDVLPHGAWTNQRIVEVAVRNWPQAGLFHELKGVMGAQRQLSANDRKLLRGGGMGTTIDVDGHSYISNTFGISTAGTSVRGTQDATHILRQIKSLTNSLDESPDYFRLSFQKAGKRYPKEPVFRLTFINGAAGYGFAIREEKSGVMLTLP